LVPFKAAHLIHVANVWKPFDLMKIEMCTTACGNIQFRMQRQVVELEKRYLILNRVLSAENGSVSTRKFQSIVRTCGERWRLDGQQVAVLINGDFGPCMV
jgi:hypothetical protein